MRRPHDARALVLVALLAASLAVASLPATATSHDGAGVLSTGEGGLAAAAVGPDDSDVALKSGRTHWAGQRLFFDGSAVVPGADTASASERTFQVRRVTDDGDVGPLVREFAVDAEGEAVVDTAALDGEFLLVYDGDPVYVQDGTGYADSPPDGTAVTVGNSAWEVAVQTISASWSDDRVTSNEVVDLHVESNRGFFLVEVSADGLDFEDLAAIFDPHVYAIDHDAMAADDVIVLRAGANVDLPAYFAGIDDGEYALSIEVADADAATTAAVRVGRGRTTSTTEAPATVPPETTTAAVEPTTSPTPVTTTATRSPTSPAPTETASAGPVTTTAPGQPGFGALAGALAVVAAAVMAGRRRP